MRGWWFLKSSMAGLVPSLLQKKNYGLIPIWHSSKGQKKALDGLLENFIEMIPKAIPKASLIFMLLPEKVEHLNRDQY